MLRKQNSRSLVHGSLAMLVLVLAGCATTADSPQGSSPADKLRKAESRYDVEGDLEITVSRTR